MRYWLVMPAAGSGRRFGESYPKQYTPLCGRTLLEWALTPFLADPRCAAIVLALAAEDAHFAGLRERLAAVQTVVGGGERAQSVERGLGALEGQAAPDDWVLVHDAARPCLTRADLDRLLRTCADRGLGGVLATPVPDTLKRAAADDCIERTVERSGLWRALTPQMFRYGELSAALRAALASGRFPTDEAQAIEWAGGRALLVPGAASNIKVTSPEDLLIAQALLERRA